MYGHHIGEGQYKRLGAALIGLLVLVLLLRGRSTNPVFSSWNDAEAQAGGLSGTVSQVGQVGQGDTLVAPPDVPAEQPWGNPVGGNHVVLTQGYGTGSHAPAAIWGAIDLAVDGDGDGEADPAGSVGAPIRATMSGIAHVTPDSWPAGNHIWVIGGAYKTGYSHLDSILVAEGQYVARGTVIGTLGASGMASGPHLDYQIWYNDVNQNPLDFHPLP